MRSRQARQAKCCASIRRCSRSQISCQQWKCVMHTRLCIFLKFDHTMIIHTYIYIVSTTAVDTVVNGHLGDTISKKSHNDYSPPTKPSAQSNLFFKNHDSDSYNVTLRAQTNT